VPTSSGQTQRLEPSRSGRRACAWIPPGDEKENAAPNFMIDPIALVFVFVLSAVLWVELGNESQKRQITSPRIGQQSRDAVSTVGDRRHASIKGAATDRLTGADEN
jgi:hypothetical protein